MNDNEIPQFRRFSKIVDAHLAALGGRSADDVGILELLPAIYAAVPDTSAREIAAALRWGARRFADKADALERRDAAQH